MRSFFPLVLPLITALSLLLVDAATALPNELSAGLRSRSPITSKGKRGLAYNNAAYTRGFAGSDRNSEVTWAYNWGPQETSSEFDSALEFVPLLYNNDADLCSKWSSYAQKAIANGTSALMSFNEPDMCQDGSSCMNISTAVSTYKQYMQPFAGKALLGAPAITNTGSSPGRPAGPDYLKYFIGNCTGCQIDYVNMHWYSNKYAGVTYLKYQVEQVRAVAGGRPIWITEFGFDYTEPYTAYELQTFLDEAMTYLDNQTDVARYSYFMDAPGMLINSDGTDLSSLGVFYNNFTVVQEGEIELLGAFFADRDVTTQARLSFLSDNKISIDTSCLDCTFGSDPWWGTLKTLHVLYSYMNQTYLFNAVESTGSYTILPSTVATSPGVTSLSNITSPTYAGMNIVGIAWGNSTVQSMGTYTSLYNHHAEGSSFFFSDGLFGGDSLLGSQKSGVIWYEQEGNLTALSGKDGNYYSFY